jgi:hypothetical protein
VKRIVLRVVPDDSLGMAPVDWREMVRQVIRHPLNVQQGADIDELRRGIRVLDALDRAEDGVLELEDADWEHLRAKTTAMQWGFVDRRMLQFIDDVLEPEAASP